MHRKLREAMLRLVIKTDVKDISSVKQSPKRVTPHKTQNLNVWVMDETGMKHKSELEEVRCTTQQNLLDVEIKILLRPITAEKLVKHRDCHFSIFFFHLKCTHINSILNDSKKCFYLLDIQWTEIFTLLRSCSGAERILRHVKSIKLS